MSNYIYFYKHILISWIRYGSMQKAVNFLKISISYIISVVFRINKHHVQPFFITVEPADFCQLQCPECPVGASKRNSGNTIDFSVFQKLVDELRSTLFHMQFYFQGEPLLNRQLAEMIRDAHKAKIYTSISTNAQLLNEKTAHELVLSGLDKIIISMDGATQEVYEKYRIGGKLNLALKGIEWINRWKKEYHSATPFVEIQLVVFKTNEHQLDAIRQLAKQYKADKLTLKSAQIYNFEQGSSLHTTIAKYSRYTQLENGTYTLKNKLQNRCYRLWSGAVVDAKGNVLPCCFDKNGMHSFGDISQQSFATVYSNQTANKFRQSIIENRSQHEICRNCTSK